MTVDFSADPRGVLKFIWLQNENFSDKKNSKPKHLEINRVSLSHWPNLRSQVSETPSTNSDKAKAQSFNDVGSFKFSH